MSAQQPGWEDSLGDAVQPGDVLAGKYRVDRVLGVGGMGVVVQAWHLQLDERVAVKFLLPEMGANQEALARFEREARAAFKIKSEHVARVSDVGKLDSGAPYMVMEFLAGADLASLIERNKTLPIHDAVEYVLQAAEAVAEAHTIGIIHRDLKPENLFLIERADGSPCIKVLDFGLSKVRRAPGDSSMRSRALTATQQVMGTPQYMSPEQWMSAKDVGPSTDLWALGVIIYELVTGVQPFQREQLAQMCSAILNAPHPLMSTYRPDVPPALENVVARCLAKRPEDRFPNVAELALALAPFTTQRGQQSAMRVAATFQKAGVTTSAGIDVRTAGLAGPQSLGVPPEALGSYGAGAQSLGVPPEALGSYGAGGPAYGTSPTALASTSGAHPAMPGAGFDLAAPGRAHTAQSWQQAPATGPARSRKALVVAALAGIGLAGGIAAALALGRGSTSTASAAASSSARAAAAADAEPATRTGVAPTGTAGAGGSEQEEAVDAAASASATAPPAATAGPAPAKPWGAKPPPRTGPPVPPKTRPKNNDDLFRHR
ncbi:MAG: serine/threonine protein kinase [Deltaproteobacteria bacterium]|nr:serine/threonine protein kinase [Deltaproteobacteria bacterium]